MKIIDYLCLTKNVCKNFFVKLLQFFTFLNLILNYFVLYLDRLLCKIDLVFVKPLLDFQEFKAFLFFLQIRKEQNFWVFQLVPNLFNAKNLF